MRSYLQKNRGFLQIVTIVITIVVILSFLQVDVRGRLESSNLDENLIYVWNEYLMRPFFYLWYNVVVPVYEFTASSLENLPKPYESTPQN
jgi:hypothetical protein